MTDPLRFRQAPLRDPGGIVTGDQQRLVLPAVTTEEFRDELVQLRHKLRRILDQLPDDTPDPVRPRLYHAQYLLYEAIGDLTP